MNKLSLLLKIPLPILVQRNSQESHLGTKDNQLGQQSIEDTENTRLPTLTMINQA